MLSSDDVAAAFSHTLARERRNGCIDQESFKAGMRGMAGAVNVLTTVDGGVRYGLTATAVCSLSADPPRLLACVNKNGVSYGAMRSSRLIRVNVLSDPQVSVAETFAGPPPPGSDRFSVGAWTPGILEGVPVLSGACCSFECRIAEIIDGVSHGILVCDIFGVTCDGAAKPLLYFNGRFSVLHEPQIDPRYALQF